MDKSILFVGTFLSHINGFRSVCEDRAAYCKDRGWHVITTSHHPARIPRLIDILSTIWKHKDTYQAAQIDVYSGAAFLWAEAAAWLLKRLNKPFCLTLHGGNLPEFSVRWPARVSRLLQSANIITAPSRYILESVPFDKHNTRLLPNHIYLDSFRFRLRDSPKPNLIWLRAFHSIYNPDLAPRVLAELLPEFPDVSLVMVGPDKGDGSLEETKRVADTLGVTSRITFPGGVAKNDVPKWLAKGEIFINTTDVDNTPVSILEAMATGLCVVSTKVGGIPYLLEDEKDALLVPPNDARAMSEAVRRVLTEPGLTARLSSNARKKAEQFDWSVIMPQWEAILGDIVRKP